MKIILRCGRKKTQRKMNVYMNMYIMKRYVPLLKLNVTVIEICYNYVYLIVKFEKTKFKRFKKYCTIRIDILAFLIES